MTGYITYVYVIQAGVDGPIKVGSARDVHARIATLQTGNARKLHLLFVFPCGEHMEWALHKRLAPNRVRGEWFSGPLVDEALESFDGLADYLRDGWATERVLPDYRQFGDWSLTVSQRGGPMLVRFVEPASLAPTDRELERRENLRRSGDLRVVHRARHMPSNAEADKLPLTDFTPR